MRKFRLNCLSALRVVIVQATALPQRAAGAPAPQEGWDVAVYPILVWVPLGIPPPCRGRTPQRLASYHGRRGAAAVDHPVERYNAPGGPAGTHALSWNVYTAFAWPLRGRDSASLESMCSTLDGARRCSTRSIGSSPGAMRRNAGQIHSGTAWRLECARGDAGSRTVCAPVRGCQTAGSLPVGVVVHPTNRSHAQLDPRAVLATHDSHCKRGARGAMLPRRTPLRGVQRTSNVGLKQAMPSTRICSILFHPVEGHGVARVRSGRSSAEPVR